MVTARIIQLSVILLLLVEASQSVLLTHLLQMTRMRAILLGMIVFTSFFIPLTPFCTYFDLTYLAWS